jgi:hypothetical protein
VRKLNTEHAEAILAKLRRDIVEPHEAKSITESALPHLAIERRDIELPIAKKSSTLAFDANSADPRSVSEEPRRLNPRTESDEPR